MKTVLLTTSGTGSRLGSLTKYTNKSLVKIGEKLAICYIIENYPEDTEFIITLGYYGNLVIEFLELAYPNRSFKYVNVSPFDGEGSSLGYSMLSAKEYLQKPFIFHCCDSLTFQPIKMNGENILYVVKDCDFMSYSSINVSGDYVIRMNKKGIYDNDYIYTGISSINNYNEFWTALDNLYKRNRENTSLSDINVYEIMIQNDLPIKYCVLESYYDTGNMKSYTKTCSEFECKHSVIDKNNESLCFFQDRVIKFCSDSDTNRKRILRGKDLELLIPRILNSTKHFIGMEYCKGTVLSECSSYGEVDKLLIWAKKNLWLNETVNDNFKNTCHNFYYDKTLSRLKTISFLDKEISTVNGINTGLIYDLLKDIDFKSLETDTFYRIHGDFILDNIIKSNSGDFVLLDWRHEFADQILLGDIYYDLAKLRHNIIFNHKNINNNLYSYSDNNDIVVDLKCNYFLIKQLDEFTDFIKKNNFNEKKIRLLTALIWINMSPLYEGNLSKFLFYFGKLNLYLANQERPYES